MTRSAAAKATEAADALLDWLRTQQRAEVSESPTNAHSAQHFGDEAGLGVVLTGPSPVVAASATPEPIEGLNPDDFGFEPRAARASDPDKPATGTPLRLAHTDWLHHRLTISGPEAEVTAFRQAAAGAGTIPWHLDLDRMEEDLFHRLVAPPSPQSRTLSLAGARIVAGQLREAVDQRQKLAVARVGRSRACPFDLHTLLPVPEAVIQLGPDHPESLAWLWQHWGTTQALRHVTDIAAGEDEIRRPEPAQAAMSVKFWSADWTPWRALAQIAQNWLTLRFDTRPTYDPS